MRKEQKLIDNWLFHKGDINISYPTNKGQVYAAAKTERKKVGPASYLYPETVDDFGNSGKMRFEQWEKVSVPHDYIINQDNDKSENNALGYFHYTNAWYRLHFGIGEEYKDKRITLNFEGIAGKSVIYLNGCLVYRNFSSYNSFEVDITDVAYFEQENVLAVYVDTTEFEGWWYQGGGIYRDVTLCITDKISFDLYGVYAPVKKLKGNNWQIDFENTVRNDYFDDETEVEVQNCLLDKNGDCVLKSSSKAVALPQEKAVTKSSEIIESPMLWDTENPNLYTIRSLLIVNGEQIDENYTRIGFRDVKITTNGLFINDKKTVIKGVCCHQDFGLTGLAVPNNIAKYKIKLIKEMGANGYRTSHYQQSTATMDALDELGFIVMDETRWFESTTDAVAQLETLVKRDRNRPSVFFWSTGNEEPFFVSENGRRIHRKLANTIKKLDNTRFITAAEDKSPEKSTIYDYCDVIGINYNLNIYDKVHEMCPDKAVFASECCATGTTRDWNFFSAKGRITDKDQDTNSWFLGREKTWKFLNDRPYVLGGYQWIAIEHRGEAVWPAICSKSGAIDLFLQKKGAFYQNKSFWTDEPMVHIVPHWNFEGFEGKEIPVTVYTNCDEVELFLNGKSLGKKQIEKYGHGEWNVKYVPGKIAVKGYINGKFLAEDCRETTGKPVGLKLTQLNDFKANGEDIALFVCECVDEQGRTVPDANEFVKFYVSKNAEIIGTGSDNCDSRNVKNTDREMYMGKILVGVKPKIFSESFELLAVSNRLKTAIITVNIA
ncbi:MAG: DUF4982 domain-containing protein [Alphaproteobacteria bacterium]|nr:DUF4982 domain-containing protein [Alphaproteobacteria bacterium]